MLRVVANPSNAAGLGAVLFILAVTLLVVNDIHLTSTCESWVDSGRTLPRRIIVLRNSAVNFSTGWWHFGSEEARLLLTVFFSLPWNTCLWPSCEKSLFSDLVSREDVREGKMRGESC